MPATASPDRIAPRELARTWGVSVDKIHALITSGQLRAIDVSLNPGVGLPRWKIRPEDIVEFDNRRASRPATPKPTRRRRRTPTNVTEYF